MAKNNETPVVVSYIPNQGDVKIFIPRQTHNTPSPEKEAMTVGVGDAEIKIGRILIGASRGGGGPKFFDENTTSKKKLSTLEFKTTQNAAFSAEAAESFTP
jgi:hypothetical protein